MEMGSLKSMTKVKKPVPSCLSGASWNSAVSGVTTVAVASLVSVSTLLAPSVKDTRTLMVLPTSSATRV